MRPVFSYRNRARLRRVLLTLLIVLAVALALCIVTLAYLDRYIVYDQEGAHLDVDWKEHTQTAPTAAVSSIEAEISYVTADDDAAIGTIRKVTGYYVTREMLQNPDAVRQTLESGSYYAVLFDLRDGFGAFYYPTAIGGGRYATSVDTQAVGKLISDLKQSGVYLIARIPAFADQNYCMNNTDLGLPLSSGALWADSQGCYWMDPANPAVISRIESVCSELQTLGFREVVLDSFHFPQTDSIVYDESERSKEDILIEAATTLQSDLGLTELKVSFGIPGDMAFPLMLTQGRLYFNLDDGAEIAAIAATQAASVITPDVQLVFLTESHDTRFDDFGHLSPAVESAVPTEE